MLPELWWLYLLNAAVCMLGAGQLQMCAAPDKHIKHLGCAFQQQRAVVKEFHLMQCALLHGCRAAAV
jgi:hypothetical protein